ncbi:uncharacterized protein BDZ99DRAFT_450053 [Mytilinidion resinicola]|uniref:Uncharacterized protein n=1 Tax=Mytilinidion resinicola TaxID=574789 RepID=A0A6A6Y9I9_9PEZI|nr:uncharacterized protein BDZ99DRAFT_450053 [Mytilinidion resinicola]KAF2805481.1 hypothetical protein BDZ99DRAFT_450053 [Mytilinidion resinicola]
MFQDSTITFGQRGGYYFGCESKRCHGSTPKKLRAVLDSNDTAEVYYVTLGAASSFFVSYKTNSGSNQIQSDGLPIHLETFLSERDRYDRNARDIRNIRVTLGPQNSSWYATDGKSWMWQNLPRNLESALHSQKSSAGSWTSPPRIVALGADTNFLLITESNAAFCSLSQYRTLRKMIQFSKTQVNGIAAIKDVVLHSYRYQCFVAESNNGTLISENVPPHSQRDMDTFSEALKMAADRKLYRTPSRASPPLQATLRREWTDQARQSGDDLAREIKLKMKVNVSLSAGSIARLFG